MKRTLAALGIATLAGTTMLSAAHAGQPPKGPPAATGQMQRGPGARGPADQFRFHRGDRAMHLAERLSALETLVGIRANQIDAWRDYTTALLALFEPPAPPPAPAPDAEKAFARQERMIAMINERAARAATLEKAITALKAVLTPDQLDKLGKAEMDMRPAFGPRGMHGQRGPMMDGPEGRRGGREMGPGGRRPGGERPGFQRGPAGGPPSVMPDDGPGGPGMPDLPDDEAQPDDAPTPG